MKQLHRTAILLIASFLFMCWTSHAQLETNNNKYRFGGSISLGFGDGFFTAGLAPSVIYDFNRYWSAGVGLSGSYLSSDATNAYTVGGSLIGFFRPYQGLRLSTEFEQLYVNVKQNFNGESIRRDYTYPALFLGLGYTTGPVTAGLKYDVLYDETKSIYGSALLPFVSIYF